MSASGLKPMAKISVFIAGIACAFGGSVLFRQSASVRAAESQWILPSKPGDPLLWGRKDGVVFGLPSVEGLPGPRGLIRIGVISAKTGGPELLNFIAVEPVVTGRKK